MNKKILTGLITTLIALLFSSSAFALTEGDWEFQLLDDEVTITGYHGEGGDVVIPETIYGVKVTKIENEIFEDNIKSLTLPKWVKEVGRLFWLYSDNLQEIILPEGLEKIHSYAFSSCPGLESVHLPSTLKEIGIESFYQCHNLSQINFPHSLTSIGLEAFSGCNFKTLELPATITFIDGGAFSNNPNLTSITIKSNIKDLPAGRYSGFLSGCTSLTEVSLPNTLESIGGHAFSDCVSIKNIIFPTSLKAIGYEAFTGCNGLTEVVIPYGVEFIDERAFGYCQNLKSLYIPDSVTNLSHRAINDSNNCIIYCTSNSPASKVCKENSISYLTDKSVNTGIHVLYNGTRISFHSYNQNPEIIKSRTLVPLRAIFEAMDADVQWDDATKTAIATRGNITIKISIGANEMYKNGQTIAVDVPAQISNSRTMIPVRVIAEAFGADVQWNANGKTVLINE